MVNGRPRVSIGLPVYNGERFLKQTIDAILAQTFTDFELIIADNASTDATSRICQDYAETDPRIRLVRNERNIGISPNFNLVATLATAPYFKWAADDDLHMPDFVARCVDVLDHDPSTVLAYTRATSIDAAGRATSGSNWGHSPLLHSSSPHVRFGASLEPPEGPMPLQLFGVMRIDNLRQTRMFEAYPDADRALVSELSLLGRLMEVPEPLFLQREHARRHGNLASRDRYASTAQWDPRSKANRRIYPHWRLLERHLDSVRRAPLPHSERIRCYGAALPWTVRHTSYFLEDIVRAGGSLPAVGPWIERMRIRQSNKSWTRNVRRAFHEISSRIPEDATLVLIDEAAFGNQTLERRRVLPFIEREGAYWGPPDDDDTAILEFERMRTQGARYVVVGWPAFWWLDYYAGFFKHVRAQSTCILSTDRVFIFDFGRNEGQ